MIKYLQGNCNAGLTQTELSRNDIMYISRLIDAMLVGMKSLKEKEDAKV